MPFIFDKMLFEESWVSKFFLEGKHLRTILYDPENVMAFIPILGEKVWTYILVK